MRTFECSSRVKAFMLRLLIKGKEYRQNAFRNSCRRFGRWHQGNAGTPHQFGGEMSIESTGLGTRVTEVLPIPKRSCHRGHRAQFSERCAPRLECLQYMVGASTTSSSFRFSDLRQSI